MMISFTLWIHLFFIKETTQSHNENGFSNVGSYRIFILFEKMVLESVQLLPNKVDYDCYWQHIASEAFVAQLVRAWV